jgi:class 3 adenylate cyclase
MTFLVNAKTKEKITLDKEVYSIGTFADSDTRITSNEDFQVIIKAKDGKLVLYKGCGKFTLNRKHVLKKILEDGDELIIGDETFIFSDRMKADLFNTRVMKQEQKDAFLSANEKLLAPELLSFNDKFAEKFSLILEINDLHDSIVSNAINYSNASQGFLIITEKDGKEFTLKSLKGLDREEADKLDSNFIDKYLSDFKVSSKILNNVQDIYYTSITNMLIVKLKIRSKFFGYLCLFNKNLGDFNDKDRFIIESLAINASVAMDKIQLLEKLRNESDVVRKLQRYLPRKAIAKLLGNKAILSMTGASQVCTVLFIDIYNFAEISKLCTPVELVTLLNDYFTVMTRVVFSFNGSTSKFMGDSLMAVFGSPLLTPNHPLESVLAALEMQRQANNLKEKFFEKYGLENFHIRIGINTGEVVYGNVGPPQRMDFTVLGDNVSLAEFIKSQANHGTILISASTYEKVKSMVRAKPMQKIKLGNQAIGVHEVNDKTENEIFFKTESDDKADYNIRDHIRVDIKTIAFVMKNGNKNQGVVRDISLGGLCLKISGNYKNGEEIELTFKLNEDLVFKNIKGIIKYVKQPKRTDIKNENNLLMGIEFTKLSDNDYIQLVNYIDRKCFSYK